LSESTNLVTDILRTT